MAENYSSGVAFILEGDTEKVFYLTLLEHLSKKYPTSTFEKFTDNVTGEKYYVLKNSHSSILIKINVVGSVSQISNSGNWFNNLCYDKYKHIRWTAFLCYDTDNYNNDITKFYEGDWKRLRKSIEKHNTCQVIDLAAKADIEDTMLIDAASIFSYLNIEPIDIPSGAKGKSKLKKIFRCVGPSSAYHEGERAEALIRSLDMEKIINSSPINLSKIEEICFSSSES